VARVIAGSAHSLGAEKCFQRVPGKKKVRSKLEEEMRPFPMEDWHSSGKAREFHRPLHYRSLSQRGSMSAMCRRACCKRLKIEGEDFGGRENTKKKPRLQGKKSLEVISTRNESLARFFRLGDKCWGENEANRSLRFAWKHSLCIICSHQAANKGWISRAVYAIICIRRWQLINHNIILPVMLTSSLDLTVVWSPSIGRFPLARRRCLLTIVFLSSASKQKLTFSKQISQHGEKKIPPIFMAAKVF